MFLKLHTSCRRVKRFLLLPLLVLLFTTISQAQNNGLSCIGTVNLSLAPSTCSGMISVDMLVNSSDYDTDAYTYELVVTDLNDNPIANNFGIDALGQQFKAGARATSIADGTISNFCWSFVNVEYKVVPEIVCISPMTGSGMMAGTGSGTGAVMVSCLVDPSNYPRPSFTSSCGIDSEIVQVGADAVVNVCDPANPDLVAIVTKSFQAVNPFGGFSNICTVDYHVKTFDFNDVVFPTIATVGSCVDDEIITDPANLGIPFILTATGSGTVAGTGSGIGVTTFDTTFLYPTPPSFCNILVSLENDTIAQDECEIKVLREWTIQQWLCNNTEKIDQRKQIITLRDTEGPNIDCPTGPIAALASGTTCRAFVNMPTLDVDDTCSEVIGVSMEFFPEGTLNSNGGNITLPVGSQIVKYIARDACNGESICEVVVNVSDGAPPVVICEQHVAISLTNNGTAHVPASVFDDGSYGCGFSHVLVAKMQDICMPDTVITNPDFADHVKFCCVEAVNPPMVRLRAYNYDGSFNECMTEITIQDKNPVSLVCPSDITVSCDFVYDSDDLSIFGKVATVPSDRNNIIIDAESVMFGDGIGRDGLATGGCGMLVDEGVTMDQSTISCGTGSIRRTFTISNENDTEECTQLISIEGGSDFDEDDIVFPQDTTIDIPCGIALTTTDITGKPVFMEADCQQLGASFTDEVFTNVDVDSTCRKIFRYWTVIDWCNTDPVTGQPKRYPEASNGRELQVIKIVKTQKPVVECPITTLFESVEASCLVSDVDLSARVTGCPNTTEYNFRYLLDFDCDGTVDSIGTSMSFNGTLVAGDHCITWTATDLCGNVSDPCTHNFQVRNNKGPSAVCIANLVISLENMDTSGDGVPDTVMQVLWANDIDSGSSQSCGNPITFSFSRDSIVNGMSFNCTNANARTTVGLYVHDNVTGNVGECWTEVEVQDQAGLCTGGVIDSLPGFANISGLLTTETGERIAEVEVSLQGSELSDIMTNQDGLYAFGNMPMGGNYTVIANKNQDHINGVSTLDLVMIQKHILGVDILDSPYKVIAADINKSNNVTASDIVELRKVILGEQAEFNNNASWRFIDKDYSFPQANNPWHENFPEEYDVLGLEKNMTVDFVGIKVGDVSGNASANATNGAEPRSTQEALRFVSEVNELGSGLVAVTISSTNFDKVDGFQMTLGFDASAVEYVNVRSSNIEISNANIGTYAADRGMISMSWSSAIGISLEESNEVFTLTFRKKGQQVPVLEIGSDLVSTEAYFNGNTTGTITLEANSDEGLVLNQNVPNPWKDQTTISFSINETGNVNMRVIDMSGKTLVSENNQYQRGQNYISLDRSAIPQSGVYMIELRYKSQSQIKRMIVLD